MIADVQMWLDDPGSDYGWLLLGDESTTRTTKRFDTRENSVPSNRPVLTVEFEPPSTIGDMNCDGLLNGFDIDPFVLVLQSEPPYDAYYAQYPDCDHTRADVNQDGLINGFDIDAFVALLSGG